MIIASMGSFLFHNLGESGIKILLFSLPVLYFGSYLLISQLLYPTRFSWKLMIFYALHQLLMLPLLMLLQEILNFRGDSIVIWLLWMVLDLCWRKILFKRERESGTEVGSLVLKVLGGLFFPIVILLFLFLIFGMQGRVSDLFFIIELGVSSLFQ